LEEVWVWCGRKWRTREKKEKDFVEDGEWLSSVVRISVYCSLTKLTDYNEREKSWPDNHNSLQQPQHHNNNKKLKNVNT